VERRVRAVVVRGQDRTGQKKEERVSIYEGPNMANDQPKKHQQPSNPPT
jgi:hypothetical protein